MKQQSKKLEIKNGFFEKYLGLPKVPKLSSNGMVAYFFIFLVIQVVTAVVIFLPIFTDA